MTSTRDPYDVIIVGAGPGGYVAAIRAAQLGMRTAVVEREHLGGICLNWGCIPTKALLRSAEIYRHVSHAETYGLTLNGGVAPVDASKVVARSRRISGQLNGGVGYLLKKNNVDVIWGEAVVTAAPGGDGAPGRIEVRAATKAAVEPAHPAPKAVLGSGAYEGRHIVIATGARPRVIPGLEPDGRDIWTYFEAMVPETIPRSLIVMGSGAIGVEFASFYQTMGTEVTVVELLDQILPAEDAEIAAAARKAFEQQGMKIRTGAKVTGLEQGPHGLAVTIANADGTTDVLNGEKLISAVGVVGNTEGLGLERIGVAVTAGVIETSGPGRTNVPGIYAIGDVAGAPMLAHKAEHEGVACVEAIVGLDAHVVERESIPGCTYCHPQIASVGLTEAEARERVRMQAAEPVDQTEQVDHTEQAGGQIRVGRFQFRGNGKAIALGEPDGFVKTIFDAQTGQLLGAHMIGAEVTELIQGFVIAMKLETTEEELMQTVFPHPTLSEMMHESVLDAYDRVIHM